MATTEYKEETLVLMDGSELKVRPLKISLLRQFLTKFDEIEKVAESNEKSIGILMECLLIAMKQYKPEFTGTVSDLEEIVDLPTVYKIVEAASGINLSDVSSILN